MASLHRGHRALLAGVVMSGLLLATTAPVSAEVDKVRTGHCSGAATWRLEVDRDEGRLDVELDILTTHAGKTWRVRMSQNGDRFYSSLRTTDHDGDIEVDRDRPDRAGTDTFAFRATQLSNGQVCRGSISF
jgi:hypothetical protein